MSYFTQNDTDLLEVAIESDVYNLVVYNDDINSFDFVIETLIEICEHTPLQAEQCTILIHYKGKCAVRTGSFDVMAKMRTEICNRGISAEVE
ncbi:MAG: ATP-dependent Clp protease adaptor ClpS [Cytophagales bacterium]|nr:MAG: ATP-dependent Clp protease adaptor ClpS [Cytophagales bacterium]